jgi:ACT domain-containing protein
MGKREERLKESGTNKVVFSDFIKSDIEYILDNANSTDEQLKIFNLLITNKYIDNGIAMQLGMSRSTYYKIKKQVIKKIIRILS